MERFLARIQILARVLQVVSYGNFFGQFRKLTPTENQMISVLQKI